MDDPNRTGRNAIPDEILEQAAVWHANLREYDPESSQAKQTLQQFEIWLAADPKHQQAFDEIVLLWGLLDLPVKAFDSEAILQSSGSLLQTDRPRHDHQQKSTRFVHFAIAACLMLFMVSGLGWQLGWITQWRSDYVTIVGEKLPVSLVDGSEVTLNSETALSIDFSDRERRVELFEGEAWFNVSHDRNRPFIIQTPHGEVKVTGTQFNLRLDRRGTTVSLTEGSVRLNTDTDSAALHAGQQANLANSRISAPKEFDQTAVTAWRRDQFVFYNAALVDVVDQLNRHRQGHIIITSKALNSLKVSGVFSTKAPDEALALILETLPVQQTRVSDYLVFLHL
jgi:transmembrane sensor